MTDKCYLNDEKWQQCCCNCTNHLPVHIHCSTVLAKGDHKCVCDIQVGWACIQFERVFTGWGEHGVGCEMYRAKPEAE